MFFLRTQNSIVPLILRLFLGGVMLPHGLQKTLGLFGGYGFGDTIDWLHGQGIPTALAVLVILAESLGSLGLIFGFLTRLCALGIACVMVGAIVNVHWQAGFFMNWNNAPGAHEGFEFHLLAIGLALGLMIAGGGAVSVDRALAKE